MIFIYIFSLFPLQNVFILILYFFFQCIKLDVNTLEMSMDLILIHKDLTFIESMKRGIFIIEPIHLSVKKLWTIYYVSN